MPLQPRHEYAAGLPRGLLAGYAFRPRSRHREPDDPKVARHAMMCTAARPISTRLEPVPELEGVQPPIHSRYTCPPRLPDPGRLAVPTRPGFVRAASRPTRAPPRVRLPSASPACCDRPAVGPCTPPELQAPRGALRNRGTGPGPPRRSRTPLANADSPNRIAPHLAATRAYNVGDPNPQRR